MKIYTTPPAIPSQSPQKYESDMTPAERRMEELNKIRSLHGVKKLRYLWDYYKFILVIAAVVLFAACTGVSIYQNMQHNPCLHILIANTDPLKQETLQALFERYAAVLDPKGEYEGIDLDISVQTNSSEGLYKLNLLIAAGRDIDVFIIPENTYQTYIGEELFEDVFDISESVFVQDSLITYDQPYFCIRTDTPNKELALALAELFSGNADQINVPRPECCLPLPSIYQKQHG